MENRIKIMKKYFRKLKGKENNKVEGLINETTTRALERAKKVLCIENHKVSKPLVISAPNLNHSSKLKFRVTEVNKEHRIDYNNAILTTIFFDENTLFYHKAEVNYITGHVDVDFAGVIKLNDIKHLQVKIDYDDPKEPKVSNLTLRLDLTGGNSIAFSLRDHFLFDGYNYPDVLTEKERLVIQTIQKAIRL
ncbi:hypothetical protein [Haploplasma axanthum]|uniref:Uncharacterized protein n=1 Tax=Haploplasma axanthum TaxID=29552 RepID=A0A449BEN7_HAPAX|nr:hypothetical protein [Haploplasma axanthum]VEU80896.1 Uncharacterised protein [Haploplasma axanthum]